MSTPDEPVTVTISCWQPLPAIVLSHKIYGRRSDAFLIEKAEELLRFNPVPDRMRMPSVVVASVTDMLPDVLAARRI